jgi:hypothetical protein
MASNAAIIISVSTYEHEQFMSHLPACQRDSDMMLRIIQGTGKYDKLLKLDNSPHSANALARLTEAIREWQELEIEEVFFYYSGHGILHEGEFLFPFTNFHPASKCTTSLPNSQLDQMLRSLAPSVAIKVIDACQAGTEYIKGSSEINEAMNTSKESFKSLYFFYSSKNFQKSYVDESFSYFTQSFAKSLLLHEGSEIRYHDIISHIRDDRFPAGQIPLYITQSSATEVFCNVTTELAAFVKAALPLGGEEQSQVQVSLAEDKDLLREDALSEAGFELCTGSPLLQKIRTISNECQTKDQAVEMLADIKSMVEQHAFNSIIDQCYSRSLVSSESIPSLSSLRKVAKWLQDSKGNFFVSISYDEEEYEAFEKVEYVEEPSRLAKVLLGTSGMFSPIKKQIKKEPVLKVRRIASGYSLPSGYPFACLHIILDPLYTALPGQDIYIMPIFSARKIRLFYKQETRMRVDFDSEISSDLNDWATAESMLTPSGHAGDLVSNAMRDLEQSILDAVAKAADQ